MASQLTPLELHGKENIPESGILVIPNRLCFDDLLPLEQTLSGRRVIYLVEGTMDYNPFLRTHLEKEDVHAIEFVAGENQLASFQRELHQHLAEGSIAVFVPGMVVEAPGQVVSVPPPVLKFLTSAGAPVLPLFVDRPHLSRLDVESAAELTRVVFSFGQALQREAANLSNFTEHLLIASETAFAKRPLLQSHLAYELLRGLKKHSGTAGIIDGMDHSSLSFDKLLAAAIVLSKIIKKETSKKRVGIILPPGKGGVLANVAVLFAGKVPVNLNFTAGESAVKSSIEQADIDKFITADPFVRKLTTFAWPPNKQLLLLDRILPKAKAKIALWLGLSKILSVGFIASHLKIPRKGGNEEAILLFTSGSSGIPKGVVLSHRNVLANVNQFGCRIDLKSNDKVLGSLPLFHSFGCTVTLWYPIIEGVSLVTFPSPLETARIASLIEKYQISMLLATPTFLRGYLRKAKREQFKSLKLVITGAEKLPRKVANAFEEKFGKPVMEGYGLTETSPVTNVNLPDPVPSPEDIDSKNVRPVLANRRLGSVGLCIPGVAIRITDPETHVPRPLHEPGMIWFKGPNIFEGYLNQPEKTAEVIKGGWFMTGDIGRLDEDGFLYIEGRLSRFSKIGGEMVPHETVEDVINKVLNLGDEERKIAIVGVPDEAKGESLVLLSSDPDTELQSLRTALLDAGIPALWLPKKVVEVDQIPMLASGKLDIKGCETKAREA